jgi:serine/threonine-protein kinase
MAPTEQLLDDLADAVLDGKGIDWATAESGADAEARLLLGHLQLVASVAQVHRDALPFAMVPAEPSVEHWGHLRLLERVGRGAFGEVFRAWDTRLDREVALKLLPASAPSGRDAATSIIHEGRLLARVRHPNVVTIHGAERIADRIGLWMEFVRGQTLEQLVQRGTVFSPGDVIEIGVELCRAVSAVHAAGLLHRDIKAHNVIRAEDGRVVLMDFGTGAELDDNSSTGLAGTPLYLAPEVLAGGPATVQSDIYSLGVLLYHLVTGSYPVTGLTIRDVRRAHVQNHRVGLRTSRPDVRPALARVIERAIDPRPESRYDTVEALARDLNARRRRTGMRLRAALAGVAALLVVAIGVLEGYSRAVGDARSLRTRLASLVMGSPSPVAQPVIAVLPLRNLGDPGAGLLVDSVTAGLIKQLAIINGLEVKSQTSSFMLRDKPRNLTDIGKRLGVNLIVEGDAQLSSGKLIVQASLVSTADAKRLWSGRIDRQVRSEGDVVGVVEDLTRTIVNELRLKLGPTQRRYDTDLATLDKYLKARVLRDERGRSVRDAIELFKKVIEKDPTFAPAHAALAGTYGYLGSHYPDAERMYIPPSEAAALAEPFATRALGIDPMLADAHAAMGYVHAFARQWSEAEASFRRAIELEPSLTVMYGDFVLSTLLPWGRIDDSLSTMQTALHADPLSLDARRVLAYVQITAGLYDEALDNCQRVLDEQPKFPFVYFFYTRALLFKGRTAEAIERLNEKALASKASLGQGEGVKGWIYAVTGRRAEAEEIAARFDFLPPRQAEIYGLLGDKDRAFEALEKVAILNAGRAGVLLAQPELASLRGDPRVAALRRKLGFPQ